MLDLTVCDDQIRATVLFARKLQLEAFALL